MALSVCLIRALRGVPVGWPPVGANCPLSGVSISDTPPGVSGNGPFRALPPSEGCLQLSAKFPGCWNSLLVGVHGNGVLVLFVGVSIYIRKNVYSRTKVWTSRRWIILHCYKKIVLLSQITHLYCVQLTMCTRLSVLFCWHYVTPRVNLCRHWEARDEGLAINGGGSLSQQLNLHLCRCLLDNVSVNGVIKLMRVCTKMIR